MSNNVRFINNYVRITDNGVDLISTHPFKHFSFDDIKEIRIEDGYLVKNRMPIRIIGSATILVSIYFLIQLNAFSFFQDKGVLSLLLLWRLTPLALVIGIGIMVYQTFIRSKVIRIQTESKTYKVTIKETEKQPETLGQLDSFLSQLKTA